MLYGAWNYPLNRIKEWATRKSSTKLKIKAFYNTHGNGTKSPVFPHRNWTKNPFASVSQSINTHLSHSLTSLSIYLISCSYSNLLNKILYTEVAGTIVCTILLYVFAFILLIKKKHHLSSDTI